MQLVTHLHTIVQGPIRRFHDAWAEETLCCVFSPRECCCRNRRHRLSGTTTGASNVTFNKDVLPILQKNCQTCHRPGEIGPMAFLNYEGTRPWAKSIKQAVLTKQMPPWFADPRYGHFANERKLSDADIKTVVAWVDAGAPEGNAKDMPPPMVWTEGWNIKPDLTFQLPEALHGPQGRHHPVHLFHRAERPDQGHLGDGRRSSRRQPQRGASCQRVHPAAWFGVVEGRANRRSLRSARARSAGHASAGRNR